MPEHYLVLCEPGVIHHHAQQDVHNSLLLAVRESDIGEGQQQDVEELPGVELEQCPQMRVERLVDGSRCGVQARQAVQHAGTDYCNAVLRNVAKWVRSSRQAAADVYQDLIAQLDLNTVACSYRMPKKFPHCHSCESTKT